MAASNQVSVERGMKRWVVVLVLFIMSLLIIVDRVVVSAAKADMAAQIGISDVQFGGVFSIFALGYALFQLPAGWLIDRYGPRVFLAIIVAAWSVCTALTSFATALVPLLVIRFIFGAFESGAYPAAARANYTWLPAKERGIAQGILFSGSRLGAAVGLVGATWFISLAGWRHTFLSLGLLGVIWSAFWFLWFREGPIGVATSQKQKTDWSVLRHPAVPYLAVQYFASNFTIFLCFTWLLPYLQHRFGLSTTAAGFYASIPLYTAAAANWVAGLSIDALYRRGYPIASRKLPAIAGFLISAFALILAARSPTIGIAVTCFSAATFGADLTLSPSWAASIDIGRVHTGLLSSAMNMAGNIGSFLSALAFPLLVSSRFGASSYFYIAAMLSALAAYCWWRLSWKQT
jgi:MFS transporter, ACS family, glucarate transporter